MNEAHVVVGPAAGPALASEIAAAEATGENVLIITDNKELLAELGPRTRAVELGELYPDGTEAVAAAFMTAADSWLHLLFPSALDGFDWAELLLSNVWVQPPLVHRLDAMALQHGLFASCNVKSLRIAGEPFELCVTLAAEAERRGIPVASTVPRAQPVRWFRFVVWAIGLICVHAVRSLVRAHRRNRLRRSLPVTSASPALWLSPAAKWQPLSRHIVDLARTLGQRGMLFGLAFTTTFGEGSDLSDADDPELSILADSSAQGAPGAVEQLVGPAGLRDALALLTRFIPLSISFCARIIANAASLRVNHQVASVPQDTISLLRVATNTVARTLEARAATKAWLERHGRTARWFVLGWSPGAEVQIVDRLLQRAGIRTVDYAHGVCWGSYFHTLWRSYSTWRATWTNHEADQFRAQGSNAHCEGGFMARWPQPIERTRSAKPRILAMTNYLQSGNVRLARRMAEALSAVIREFGNEIEVILRPHPHEDRQHWLALFAADCRPQLSANANLHDDLAAADLVVSSMSSAAIEALAFGVPIAFHHPGSVERQSIFGVIPKERWFDTPASLVETVRRFCSGTLGDAPERELLAACFGSDGKPRAIVSLIERLLADQSALTRRA